MTPNDPPYRGETALRESEERLQLALSAAQMGVWEWDLQTNDVFWSPECCRILGLGEHGMSFEAFQTLVHRDDLDRVMTTAWKAIADKTDFRAEFRIVRPRGEIRWVSDLGKCKYDEDGTPLRLTGTVQDITDRHQLESSLRDRENRYRSLVESSADAIFVNQGGRIVFVNPALIKMLRADSAEQILGKDLFDILHPDFHVLARERIQTILENRQAVPFAEQRFRRFDGTYVDVEVAGIPYEGAGEIAIHVTARDLTDRKKKEKALRKSEQRLRDLADFMPQIVWIADPQGNLVSINRRGTEYLGGEVEGILGTGWLEKVHPEDQSNTSSIWQYALQTGETQNAQFRIRRFDGEYRWHIARAVAIRNSSGAIQEWFGTSTDIHDQKVAEEALRASEQRYRDLVELAPDGIAILQEGRFVYVNRAGARGMGAETSDSLIGHSLSEFLHPEDLASSKERQEAILNQNRSVPLRNFRLRRLDGDWIVVESCGGPCEFNGKPAVQLLTRDITDRIRAEEALRTSEAKLRSIFETAPDIITAVDHQGTVLFINRPLAHHTAEGVTGTNVFSYVPSEFCQQIRSAIDQVFQTGETDEYETLGPELLDGTRSWYLTRVGPLFQENQIVAVTMCATNITARKHAEERIIESEELYRRLVDVLPDAVYINCQNQVVFCNSAFIRLWGAADSSAILGKSPFELYHPDSHDLMRQRIQTMMNNGTGLPSIEQQLVRFDGRLVTVLVLATPILYQGKQSILVVVHDLSQQRRSEQLLRSVLNSVSDAIISTDEMGNIGSVNPATEQLFGYSTSELLGQNVKILMPIPWRNEHDSYLENYRKTGIGKIIGKGREVEAQRRDGFTFPVELLVSEFQLDNQRQFTGVVRDVTQRKKLEEQLRQSQKMDAIGQLAGGVAHDFNNMLTVISGYSEILLTMLEVDDPKRQFLLDIRDASERATTLTRQLLAFSRKQLLEPKVVNLNDIISNIEKLLRRLIGEDIVLTILLSPYLSRVKVDPNQIEQVVLNLAVNARDAMPQGGRLRIETRDTIITEEQSRLLPESKPGRYTMLSVTDTGHGMSPDIKARIFEPFFTTKGPGKGTGLGLATVFGIVKQSDGHIEVESKPSGGSTFRVYLPSVDTIGRTIESDATVGIVQPGNETILLVEDEDAVRGIAKIALETHGYRVLEASDGPNALAIADSVQGHFDLVVTDVVMPQMSGRELIEILHTKYPNLKTLFISGYTDDAIVRHGIRDASTPFLQKPFSPLSLARKVREILDDKQ
jgi:PAS domain S-box-containing protein